VIRQDQLGLDAISIQAKRWEGTVGRAVVLAFIGCPLVCSIGVTARRVIDGSRLAKLMIDFNVGVSRHESYELKKLDLDYFGGD
jgi:restriction system protein